MIRNKWVKGYERWFEEIKGKLIECVSSMKDKNGESVMRDYWEGNIVIIMVCLFGGIGEVVDY